MSDVELYNLSSPDAATAFIQWKGTDVCLDFGCVCGWTGHLDAEFAYAVRCGGCGAVWQMPTTVALRLSPEHPNPLDPEA